MSRSSVRFFKWFDAIPIKIQPPPHNFQMMYSIINKFYNAQQSFLFLTYGTLKSLDLCPLKILNYVINKRGDNLSDKICYLLRQLCFYDALQNLDRFLLFVIDFTFLLASLNKRHLLFYIIRNVSIMLPIFVLKLICVS